LCTPRKVTSGGAATGIAAAFVVVRVAILFMMQTHHSVASA
jgi:hypothetical protein